MSKNNLDNKSNIYDHYSRLNSWSIEYAIMLISVSSNCTIEDSRKHINQIKVKIEKRDFNQLVPVAQILITAIDFGEIPCIENDLPDSAYTTWFRPLKFIIWAKKKEIKLPDGLAELVIKYDSVEIEQGEEQCKKCSNELEHLRTKVLDLQKELSIPNAKRAKSLYKGFIGLLALQYKKDKILQSFGTNVGGVNPNSKSLITLSKIEGDLNLQGINLDDETIKAIIKESISYLEEKPK